MPVRVYVYLWVLNAGKAWRANFLRMLCNESQSKKITDCLTFVVVAAVVVAVAAAAAAANALSFAIREAARLL